MWKLIAWLWLILIFISCNHNNKFDIDSEVVTEFNNLKIEYWTGDEYRYQKQMEFSKAENGIMAYLTMPKYFVGKEVLAPKPKFLTNQDRQLLSRFLEKVTLFKDTCEEAIVYSSSEYYTIMINSDTINIKRYCDWGNLTFYNLEKEMFSDFFDTLTSQRLKLENKLSLQLSGYWIPILPKKRMKRGDLLHLTKSTGLENELDCFWRFHNKRLFKAGCSNLLDLTNSKTYKWDIDEGHISLSISSGSSKLLNESDTVLTTANYGATFKLVSLTENKLILEYQWR